MPVHLLPAAHERSDHRVEAGTVTTAGEHAYRASSAPLLSDHPDPRAIWSRKRRSPADNLDGQMRRRRDRRSALRRGGQRVGGRRARPRVRALLGGAAAGPPAHRARSSAPVPDGAHRPSAAALRPPPRPGPGQGPRDRQALRGVQARDSAARPPAAAAARERDERDTRMVFEFRPGGRHVGDALVHRLDPRPPVAALPAPAAPAPPDAEAPTATPPVPARPTGAGEAGRGGRRGGGRPHLLGGVHASVVTVLAIDAGTTGVRTVAVDADGSIRARAYPRVPPALPPARLGRARLARHPPRHPHDARGGGRRDRRPDRGDRDHEPARDGGRVGSHAPASPVTAPSCGRTGAPRHAASSCATRVASR